MDGKQSRQLGIRGSSLSLLHNVAWLVATFREADHTSAPSPVTSKHARFGHRAGEDAVISDCIDSFPSPSLLVGEGARQRINTMRDQRETTGQENGTRSGKRPIKKGKGTRARRACEPFPLRALFRAFGWNDENA